MSVVTRPIVKSQNSNDNGMSVMIPPVFFIVNTRELSSNQQ